jgi:integrase
MSRAPRRTQALAQVTNDAELVKADAPFDLTDTDTIEAVLNAYLDDRGRLVPAQVAPGAAAAFGVDLPAEERQRLLTRAQLLDSMRSSAWADTTLAGYGGHVAAWRDWSKRENVPCLPMNPLDVTNFLLEYAFTFDSDGVLVTDKGHPIPAVAASSVTHRLAALNKLAEFVGVARPGDIVGVKETMRGIRRRLLTAPQGAKNALDLDRLKRCLAASTGITYGAARNRAATLLRARCEATAGQMATLEWFDVYLHENRVEIHLPKTTRNGQPVSVTIPAHNDPKLCLLVALKDLRAIAGANLKTVFTHPDGKPMTRQALHLAAKSVGGWATLPQADDKALRKALTSSAATAPLAQARNEALLLTGFYTALRRSNLSTLLWEDLEDHGADGISVLIRRSKTDQEGLGRTLWVPEPENPETATLNPAEAMRVWKQRLEAELGRKVRGKESVFVHINKGGVPALDKDGSLSILTGDAICIIVQDLAVAAGLADAKAAKNPYGAHSLRAGFVTEALRDDKLSIAEVQEVTGHRSVDVLMNYRREVNAKTKNTSRKLLGFS